MIEIKKGQTILKVSKDSYKEIFKSQGYEIVNQEEKNKEKVQNKKNEEKEKEIEIENDIVNSSKLTKKIDMGIKDNLFPSKEKKKGK